MIWLIKVIFNIMINIILAPITFIRVYGACLARRRRKY